MFCIGSPHFAAVEENAEDAGLMDVQFVFSVRVELNHTLAESGHTCCCLSNCVVNFCINKE